MFNDSVVYLIKDTNIDRPRNVIILTHDFHQLFGGFKVYLEPKGSKPHTYYINSTYIGILRHRIFPVDRTLSLTNTRTINPPSPRLLAIHRAIALILYLSAAGRHINSILRDLDQGDILVNGSTPLGYLTALRLHG